MLQKHIFNSIVNNIGFVPTKGQESLIHGLADYILAPRQETVLLIQGYAGTGKTTVVSSLVKVLETMKINSVLLAPTGRAAKVFSGYSGKKAYTIHKKIYRQRSANDGFGTFDLNFNQHKDTFFIIDEASMISNEYNENALFGSGNLLGDLFKYVLGGKNCYLILVGDTAQLPPVGMSISPALNPSQLSKYVKSVAEYCLTDVVRQADESGILFNATLLRTSLSDSFRNSIKINTQFNDVALINGSEVVNSITESYDNFGRENTIVICKSNKTANRYNIGIRNQILQFDTELTSGDFLMIVKNNYYWLEINKINNNEIPFVANGDIVRIKRIRKFEELYGFKFADATIVFPDYDDFELDVKLLLDSLYSENASITQEQNKQLFYTISEDYSDINDKKMRFQKVKENPYYNALQVKFAYAVTCHKAQGGQWDSVFIDHGWLGDDFLNDEFIRWFYTAMTRAVRKIQLVNLNDALKE
jgi:exodeoxyribonuclease V